ncbi:interleukin-12 subunit beta [Protopterus annectens]|uniref:interleukin-12 subunit beta n=1 Tax=Protopterus annectens TaxID=7888 RepID=UPI001CFAC19B|nr:interleukin-12 subunit beta [Protopterus annectens]
MNFQKEKWVTATMRNPEVPLCRCITETLATLVVDVVIKPNEPPKIVTLTCSDQHTHARIHWKKNGSPIDGHANTLEVSIRDFPDVGRYSCHSSDTGPELNYTVLLIKEIDTDNDDLKAILKKDSDHLEFIHCEAQNYSGKFTCDWNVSPEFQNVKFHIQDFTGLRHRRSIQCSDPVHRNHKQMYTVTCQELNSCAYEEEHEAIVLNLEAITAMGRYEKYSRNIFISDIIKPGPPQNLKAIETNEGLNVSWTYNEHWSKPNSFFPQSFKVEIKCRNQGCHLLACKSRSTTDNVNGILKENNNENIVEENFCILPNYSRRCRRCEICVRAKDRYQKSSFSDPDCIKVVAGRLVSRSALEKHCKHNILQAQQQHQVAIFP